MEPLNVATAPGMTKWDVLSEADRKWSESAPINVDCSGCDLHLATEADFAKHFILYVGYRNIGYCPVKGDTRGKNGQW